MQFQDDSSFQHKRDVFDGLIFIATLQIRTPLSVLQHHGEVHCGPPSAVPIYGSLGDGIWMYNTKSWSELAGRKVWDPPESCCASDIGPVLASKYLPFLKKFRAIVESNDSVDQRLSQLVELQDSSEGFRGNLVSTAASISQFPSILLLLTVGGYSRNWRKDGGAAIQLWLSNNSRPSMCIRKRTKMRALGLAAKLTSRIRDYFASELEAPSSRVER